MKAPTPNKRTLGQKKTGIGSLGNAMLPSRKAVDFLTKGSPSRQRIQEFGRLTPIGSRANQFGAPPKKKR